MVCRELTKTHEEIKRGTLAELEAAFPGRLAIIEADALAIDVESEGKR